MFTRVGVVFAALAASSFAQGVVHVVGGAPADVGFGSSMDGGADIDGDGFPDLVVGAWKGCVGSSASVVSGRTGVVIRRVTGPTASPSSNDPEYGRDVAIVGDVDLDGFPDFAVGAPLADSTTPFVDDGSIRVYSGSVGAQLAVIVGEGVPGARIGTNIARCFDVDSDGRPEVATSFGPFGVLGVRAYSTTTGQSFILLSTPIGQYAGCALTNVGDTNQDGSEELLTCGGSQSGTINKLWKLSKSGGASSQVIFDMGNLNRCAISGGMDFNGDGAADFAIANPSWTKPGSGGSQQGLIAVNSLASAAVLATESGQSQFEFLGGSLAMLPDVTGDNKADLVIGTNALSNPTTCQLALSQVPAWRLVGLGGGTAFSTYELEQGPVSTQVGFEVSLVGDVNGDGFAEFAVSSPGEGFGVVRIYSARCGAKSMIGLGCPGTGGIVPQVSASGCLTPGGTISLDVSQAVGGSIAYFVLGLGPASTPFGNGCSLNVGPVSPSLLGPFILFPLGGSGPGVGFLNIVAEVPIASPLGSLALQGLVLDPGASGGYCVTGGISLTID